MQRNELTYIVFTTEEVFEVAIGNWSEWDLYTRPLNSVETLKPTELLGHKFNSHSEPILYSYSTFIICSVSDFILVVAFVSHQVYFNGNFLQVITSMQQKELVYVVFNTERVFEVAIKSWPE